MWLMKRVIVDGWDVDRAMEEGVALGLNNESLKQFSSSKSGRESAERLACTSRKCQSRTSKLAAS